MKSVKTSILLIIKIEIIKFFKRNDIIAILGIVSIGFIYALGMRGEGYVGTKDQSAIFWVGVQLLTTTALFIGPVIMSFIGTQMLSSEIDNNSILLFNARFRNREKMYYGKSISLAIISTLLFFISVGVLFIIYFLITDSSTMYVSGKAFGNNTLDLICIIFMIYVYSFFFFPQLSLFLGVRFKPLITIVLTFCVALFCNNVATSSIIKYFNPMQYIVRLADEVASTTEIVYVSSTERLFCVSTQVILCIALCLMFNILGAKRFKERDL